MRKLKYVKLFENFQVNEEWNDPNRELLSSISHLILYTQYKGFKGNEELYANQNSNFQQYITPDGKFTDLDISYGTYPKIQTPYCIGQNGVLHCYNVSSIWNNVGTEEILDEFNRIHKRNYKKINLKKIN